MNNRQQKRIKNHLNGWINLDKPFDMTSTGAVSAVKKLFSPAKIGHAGTLDPLATGVLPLALGEATKTVQYLMEARKEYVFTVKFGAQTTTDDAEGEVIKCCYSSNFTTLYWKD
jgi:tRNA pseudouridine55 synthase